MSKIDRPLSPHLSIYRPQISSVLSITHRATGVALYVGFALVVAWLFIAAYNPNFYATFHGYLISGVGRVLLFGWTLAFFFHLANGVRHLFWDIGKGYEVKNADRSGIAVLLFTLALSLGVWAFAYHQAGLL